MTANHFLTRTRQDEEFDRLVRQEELILQVTETLTQALDEAGVTKAELARRLGKSPGFVSQVLGGGRNLTLRTLSDIAAALAQRPTLNLSCDEESFVTGSPVDAQLWQPRYPGCCQARLTSTNER